MRKALLLSFLLHVGLAAAFIVGIPDFGDELEVRDPVPVQVVSEEQLALDVIRQVGPGGHFLQQPHTMKHFKEQLWRTKIFTRQPYEKWVETGSKNVEDRVREEIHRILETHVPSPLPDKVIAEIDRIKEAGEKELTKN